MLPDETTMCHLTAFEKRCYDMVTKCKCRKWVHFQGENPQTKAVVDIWDCRDHMDHMMDIQIVQAIRQTTGSIDQLRKEVDDTNAGVMAGAVAHINNRINGIASAIPEISAMVPKLIGKQ